MILFYTIFNISLIYVQYNKKNNVRKVTRYAMQGREDSDKKYAPDILEWCARDSEEMSHQTQKTNRLAALSQHTVNKLRKQASCLVKKQERCLTGIDKRTWNLVKKANELAQHIQSVDLPEDDQINETMVYTVQQECNEILKDNSKSRLKRIFDIALHSKTKGYGNCQEKAFYAFALMMFFLNEQESLQANSSNTYTDAVSLKLAYFDNHFIVIVDERFFLDPWLNMAFPLPEGEELVTINDMFNGFGDLIAYFSFDKERRCFYTPELCESLCPMPNAKYMDHIDTESMIERQECLERSSQLLELNKNKKRKVEDRDEEQTGQAACAFFPSSATRSRGVGDIDVALHNNIRVSLTNPS